MKTILLPTDFSDNSWNAITYALQLFKEDTCTIYLLNTYTPAIYHVEYVLVQPAQFGMYDAVREHAINSLEEFKIRIKTEFNNPKHTIETIATFNTLISEINEIVTEKHIDYVIMGTQGATGAKEILFGSNTVHALKHVKCPLLAIPSGFKFEELHEVLFPTDYGIQYEERHVKPIFDLISLDFTQVNILHVLDGYGLAEYQKENKATLKTYFKEATYLIHEVDRQTVEEGISNFQLQTRINLLVMINNKHSFFTNLFFKSTINQIGFHLNVPFLVIPDKI
ncbi:universal stress protein [Aestuariibaculum suncheonense]|uniref:Universal stress protein n=1 Tax=Aestuariibaculum suncheonense TaxID=1028745 RepID=A0A8J6UAR6_9FLAO|nr:universal stress protein [Aestuariibaculum suncheonense]MBD0835603.1 universal stress protein [Aestuariibaculum suncheonense]